MAAGAFALERKICQADDPIHGRTDFVAHGGEELALGTGGFQGFLLAFEQFGIAGREFRRARLHLRFKFSGALEGIERLLFAGVVVDDDAHPFGLVGQRVDRFLPFDQYPPPVPVAVPHPVFVLQRARRRLRRKSFQTRCARAPRRRDGTRSRKSGSVMCSTPSGQPSIRQTCSL